MPDPYTVCRADIRRDSADSRAKTVARIVRSGLIFHQIIGIHGMKSRGLGALCFASLGC